MTWIPLGQRIDQLPLILAGPILRHTTPDAVTVWVALRQACQVQLQVYATEQAGAAIGCLQLIGTRSTVSLGSYLHVVAVTASSQHGQLLHPEQIYAYDLQFSVISQSPEGDGSPPQSVSLAEALTSAAVPYAPISYFAHAYPTFALPPDDLNHLRMAHGSCRKLHGEGQDALAILDQVIEQHAASPLSRPHQLFLTGDQIYGDDVADPLLWALTTTGDMLLGWVELLPLVDQHSTEQLHATSNSIADRLEKVTPQQLKPGQRAHIAEVRGGFTAGLHQQPERSKSHLFSFGEFCAAYLFSWSPVLWGDDFPSGAVMYPDDAKAARHWNREVRLLQVSRKTLWVVRRILANIPTYMIFDDHDISDDWYLNQDWCLRVLGKPLGRQTVQNGLLSYAVFQAWGNTPAQFEPEQVGDRLLQNAARWSTSAGTDQQASTTIARDLGMPPIDPHTGLPRLRLDAPSDQSTDSVYWVLDRDPQALQWHYTIRSACHEVIVLDTRTWRGYPTQPAQPTDPATLLSPSALVTQVRHSLQQTTALNDTGLTRITATFIVAPTNLINMQVIDWVQARDLKYGKIFHNDVGDSWSFNKPALAQLLTALFDYRRQVIVLSGDIHFGFVARLHYWKLNPALQENPETPHILVQLTSSAFSNTEWKTRLIHTKLAAIIPEPQQHWVGWNQQPDLLELQTIGTQLRWVRSPAQQVPFVHQLSHAFKSTDLTWMIAVRPHTLPNWHYWIDWINRQPAQEWVGNSKPASLKPLTRRGRNGLKTWLKGLWSNRWLQEGPDVVGLNNFGIVQLVWSSQIDQRAVIQDLYWLAPWKTNQAVFSRFYAPLQLEEPPPLPIVLMDELGPSSKSPG